MKENYNRRRADLLGKEDDWRPEVRSRGIENRILFAVPEREIVFREETCLLQVDAVRKLTWGEIFEILCAHGILRREGKDRFIKLTIGFDIVQSGSRKGKFRSTLDSLIAKTFSKTIKTLESE